jgi:hypothetical protein
MGLSEKTRTRLVVLNAAAWVVMGITVLSLLGGPRSAVESWLSPVES